MKKTMIYLGIVILSTFAITACNEQNCKKENEALKKENDSLKLLVNGNTLDAKTYLNEFSEKMKREKTGKIFSGPISRTDAQNFTSGFRNASTLNIPLAWEFEKSHILGLVNNNNISGVRFYASVNSSTNKFTIIAVSVNNNGDDIIGAEGEPNSLMFEFAAPCPAQCPTPNDVLMKAGEENILQEFTRTPASIKSRNPNK